jgi:hypothetical protein
MPLHLLLASQTLELQKLGLGRRYVTPPDGQVVPAKKVNPKCLVLSQEGILVDVLSSVRAVGAKGFSTHHDVDEVGTDRPLVEGALVHVCSPVAVVFAQIEPPQDVARLRIEGLVVAANLVTIFLLCSSRRIAT